MRRIERFVVLAAIVALVPAATQAAIVVAATTITLSSSLGVVMVTEPVTLVAIVASDSVPNGTMTFDVNSVPIPGCVGQPAVPLTSTSSATTCMTTLTSVGTQAIGASYSGDVYHAPATVTLYEKVVPSTPGNATIQANPYGGFTVTGATPAGSAITNFSDNAVIQLGPSTSASPLVIDFSSLNLGAGSQLAFRSGAPGQRVNVVNWDVNPSLIAGTLRGLAGTGTEAPLIDIDSPSGMYVRPTGYIFNYPGLKLDFLAGSYYIGQPFINDGIVDGGAKLEMWASDIHGSGDFNGNDVKFHTYGHANNPVHGTNYVLNFLNINPGTGVPPGNPQVYVTFNTFGPASQVVNVKINGSAGLWMPSAWPPSLQFPLNNPVIPPGGIRAAGVPNPAYGGGSMLIQATGPISLYDGGPTGTHDFVFPGAIALISGTSIDYKNTKVIQGWANLGAPFQGLFAEAPIIQDTSGKIQLFGNAQNWMNFSVPPITPVSAFTLQTNANGTTSYAPSDGIATHLNTYTSITNIAVSGGCWTCAVNTQPVDMSGPH